jgi:hypothetical protein
LRLTGNPKLFSHILNKKKGMKGRREEGSKIHKYN